MLTIVSRYGLTMVNTIQQRGAAVAALAGWRSRVVPRPAVDGLGAPTHAPAAATGLAELLGPAVLLRTPAAAARLARVPRGDGHVVLDLPGWRTSETSGVLLCRYLRSLGYDTRGWGLGLNHGGVEQLTDLLTPTVTRLAGERGPVSLVGWSLGGVIAREVARRHPEAVRRVVTYGTPIVGGPTFTRGAAAYGPQESARIAALTEELDRTDPLRVPVTVMYTRRDGVVAWRACLDHYSRDVEHLEVASTHVGMGLDPDVWEVVARRLARPVRPGDEAGRR